MIVVTDEDWYEEEHVPFLEMDHVSLELHYQYEDIRRINPLIQLQAFPGFVLVETDDTKRIEELVAKPGARYGKLCGSHPFSETGKRGGKLKKKRNPNKADAHLLREIAWEKSISETGSATGKLK